MRTAILSTLLSFGFGFLGCQAQTRMPSLGSVRPDQLCGDVKRCDVRGDEAVSTLKTSPIHLADGQGPESYLGKVAPERKAQSVLKTCGGDVAPSDWLSSTPATRTVELSDRGKQLLRASLRSHLAEQLLVHPQALTGQSATIDAVVDGASVGLGLQKVGMLSQTYWLKDAAFERRVGQCGEEEHKNIIYSLTLLRLSELTQKELESKLLLGLRAKLPPVVVATASAEPDSAERTDSAEETSPVPEPPTGGAAAGSTVELATAHEAVLRELAYGAVSALSGELRTIAALGFDEP